MAKNLGGLEPFFNQGPFIRKGWKLSTGKIFSTGVFTTQAKKGGKAELSLVFWVVRGLNQGYSGRRGRIRITLLAPKKLTEGRI